MVSCAVLFAVFSATYIKALLAPISKKEEWRFKKETALLLIAAFSARWMAIEIFFIEELQFLGYWLLIVIYGSVRIHKLSDNPDKTK